MLTPVNTPWDFHASLDDALIPGLIRVAGKVRIPAPLAPSQPAYGRAVDGKQAPALAADGVGGVAGTAGSDGRTDSIGRSIGNWYRCPPTFHAFGWIYRRDLMLGEPPRPRVLCAALPRGKWRSAHHRRALRAGGAAANALSVV